MFRLISTWALLAICGPLHAAPRASDDALRLSWIFESGAKALRQPGSSQALGEQGPQLTYERRFFFDRKREAYHGFEIGIGWSWGAYQAAWEHGEPREIEADFTAVTAPILYKLGVFTYAPFFPTRIEVGPRDRDPTGPAVSAFNAYMGVGVTPAWFIEGGGDAWAYTPALALGIEALFGGVSLRIVELSWGARIQEEAPHPMMEAGSPQEGMRFGVGLEL